MAAAFWDAFGALSSKIIEHTYPYAEQATFLRLHGVERAVHDLAVSIGQDPAVARYLLGMLLAYPLSAGFSLIPSKAGKHAFSLLSGVIIAQFVFGPAWVVPLFISLVAYTLMAAPFLRRHQHLLVFAWVTLSLSYLHIYRMAVDYMGWSLDVSGVCMLLTIKLTSLAWQLKDGHPKILAKYRAEAGDSTKSPTLRSIFQDRIDRHLPAVPPLVQYLGFVFCSTTLLAGPAFDYKEYQDGIDGSKRGGKAHWGSRLVASLTKLVVGLGLLGAHLTLLKHYDFASYLRGAVDGSKPPMIAVLPTLLQRGAFLYACNFTIRLKYYFAWVLSEGSANMGGFGYVPPKTDAKGVEVAAGNWSGVCNMDIIEFETAGSISVATKHWNKRTQHWLSTYCGRRVPKAWSTWAVYTLSAVWHGFYPGYYLFFLSAPIGAAVESALAAKVKPRLPSSGPVRLAYDLLGRIVTGVSINYLVLPFIALGLSEGLALWASCSYVGHAAMAAALVALALVPGVRKAAATPKKAQ